MSRPHPVLVPSALALTVLLAACGAEREASAPAPAAVASLPARPNLLLISIDSLRPDHLGAYGYARETSPNLDRFAAQAALFERSWAVSSWTLPTHLSIFSSLPPPVHGVRKGAQKINPEALLLTEVLAGAGYRSAAAVSGLYLDRRFGYDQGWEIYDDRTAFGQGSVHEHANVSSERIHRRALELLDQLQSPGPDGVAPFFLFLHYFDVHYDYVPPSPFDRMFDPNYTGTVDGRNFARDLLKLRALPERDLEHVRALYDGEIRWVDDWLGKLFVELERRGLDETTLVVVTSDHGEEFLDHGRFGHVQNLYDSALRTPLLVRLPGGLGGERRFAQAVGQLDLAPTLAAAAGIVAPPAWQGRDLMPLLTGRGELAPADLHADLFGRQRALVAPDGWKAILSRRQHQKSHRSLELYELGSDPRERQDRAESDPGQGAEMRTRIERAYRRFQKAAVGLESGKVATDPEFERQLRALGYL